MADGRRKMIFNAIYETDNEADGGFRVVEAADLQAAKLVLKAQIEAEGTHGYYQLRTLTETDASWAARRASA